MIVKTKIRTFLNSGSETTYLYRGFTKAENVVAGGILFFKHNAIEHLCDDPDILSACCDVEVFTPNFVK